MRTILPALLALLAACGPYDPAYTPGPEDVVTVHIIVDDPGSTVRVKVHDERSGTWRVTNRRAIHLPYAGMIRLTGFHQRVGLIHSNEPARISFSARLGDCWIWTLQRPPHHGLLPC